MNITVMFNSKNYEYTNVLDVFDYFISDWWENISPNDVFSINGVEVDTSSYEAFKNDMWLYHKSVI